MLCRRCGKQNPDWGWVYFCAYCGLRLRRRRRWPWVLAVLLVAAAGAAVGYRALQPRPRSVPQPEPPIPVVVYVAKDGDTGKWAIYAWNESGKTRRLVGGLPDQVKLTASPDGRYVSWVGADPEDSTSKAKRLYILPTTRGKPQAVSGFTPEEDPIKAWAGGQHYRYGTVTAEDSTQVWSPDGRWLIAGATTSGDSSQHAAWLVSVSDTSRPSLLAEGDELDFPLWSPDSKHCLLCEHTQDEASLLLAEAETGQTKTLLSDWYCCECAWSPRGDKVAVAHTRQSGAQSEFPIFDVATGEEASVGLAASSDAVWLTWSRTGSLLAFYLDPPIPDDDATSPWVVPSSGGEPRRLPLTDAWVSFWLPGEGDLIVVGEDGGLWQYDSAVGRLRQLAARLPGPRFAGYGAVELSRLSQRLVLLSSTGTGSAAYATVSEITREGEVNPSFPALRRLPFYLPGDTTDRIATSQRYGPQLAFERMDIDILDPSLPWDEERTRENSTRTWSLAPSPQAEWLAVAKRIREDRYSLYCLGPEDQEPTAVAEDISYPEMQWSQEWLGWLARRNEKETGQLSLWNPKTKKTVKLDSQVFSFALCKQQPAEKP